MNNNKTTSSIRKGLNYQDYLAIKYALELFIENKDFVIYLDVKKCGNLDDIIITQFDSNKVKAFQVKYSTKRHGVYKVEDFTDQTDPNDKGVNIKKFANSWKKVKNNYQGKEIEIYLFTNHSLDTPLLELLEEDNRLESKFIEGKKRNSKDLRDKLITASGLNENEFKEFLSSFHFYINQSTLSDLEDLIKNNLLNIKLNIQDENAYKDLKELVDKIYTNKKGLDNLNFKNIQEIIKKYEAEKDERKDILETLQKITPQKKEFLEKFSDDIKFWLEIMGFKCSGFKKQGEYSINFLAKNDLPPNKIYLRCIEGEIDNDKINDLQNLHDSTYDEFWVICEQRISKSGEEFCKNFDKVKLFTYKDFLSEKIWKDYIYLLNELITKERINEYFVFLGCHKKKFNSNGAEYEDNINSNLVVYLEQWLKESGKIHISILGEFGSGKTWVSKYIAFHQLKKFLANPLNERLPIYINLKGFDKFNSIEDFGENTLLQEYKLPFTEKKILEKLSHNSKILIIFDGFDEMTKVVTDETIIENYWEIAKFAETESKIILTSRIEYFKTSKKSVNVLTGKELSPKNMESYYPKFELIYLNNLTNDQVKEALLKQLGEEDGKKVFLRLSQKKIFTEISQKPIIIKLLISALNEANLDILGNTSQIYLYAIKNLILRNVDNNKTFNSFDLIFNILLEIAWKMFTSQNYVFHYSDIPDLVKNLTNLNTNNLNMDEIDIDLRNQTLFHRDSLGNYEFAHKSLLEFFIAVKIANILGILREEYFKNSVDSSSSSYGNTDDINNLIGFMSFASKEFYTIRLFMSQIMDRKKDITHLWEIYKKSKQKKKYKTLTENIIYTLIDFGADLSNKDLSNLELKHTLLQGRNLENTNFSNSVLHNAGLFMCNLKGSNFENAEIRFDMEELNPDYPAFMKVYVMKDNTGNNKVCFVGKELIVCVGWYKLYIFNFVEKEWYNIPVNFYVENLNSSSFYNLIALNQGHKVFFYNLSTGKWQQTIYSHENKIHGTRFGSNGKYFCSFSDNFNAEIAVFSFDNSIPLNKKQLSGCYGIFDICFRESHKDILVVGRSGNILFLDIETLDIKKEVKKESIGNNHDYTYSICTNPNETLIAVTSNNPYILILDENGTEKFKLETSAKHYHQIRFSPNGKYLCVSSNVSGKSHIELFKTDNRLDNWETIFCSINSFSSFEFSNDSKYLAVYTDTEESLINIIDLDNNSIFDNLCYRLDFTGMNIKNLKAPGSYINFFQKRNSGIAQTKSSLMKYERKELIKMLPIFSPLKYNSEKVDKKLTKSQLVNLILDSIKNPF